MPKDAPDSPVAAVSAAGAQSQEALGRYSELLTDPNPGIRIAAAHVLLQHGDPEGKPILLGALRSPEVHHRIDAALALKGLGDPQIVIELRRAAEVERHPLARIILKEVLKEISR